METSNAFPGQSRNNVIMLLLAGLAALVFAAIVYRVENPSIVQHEEQRAMPGAAKEGMGGMQGMSGVAETMKRLQSNPEDVDAMRELGMTFMDMQAWDKALTFWDMLLQRNPVDAMALNQKGFCLFEQEKFTEAADVFEKLLSADRDNPHGHYNLGILYKDYLRQPDKGNQHFQIVIDTVKDDPELVESARKELAEAKP